ncbi:hypothetical protein INR49_030736, partial [Caranx melampygus]
SRSGEEGDSTARASGSECAADGLLTDSSPRRPATTTTTNNYIFNLNHEQTPTEAAGFLSCVLPRLNNVIVIGGSCTPVVEDLTPLH